MGWPLAVLRSESGSIFEEKNFDPEEFAFSFSPFSSQGTFSLQMETTAAPFSAADIIDSLSTTTAAPLSLPLEIQPASLKQRFSTSSMTVVVVVV
jgi:hypothetical protein